MGYRIVYDRNPKYDDRTTFHWGKFQTAAAGFLAVFFLLTGTFWPEGKAMLQRILIPGDAEVTIAAFSSMVEQIQAGEPIGDAVTAFCGEIIENGQAPD